VLVEPLHESRPVRAVARIRRRRLPGSGGGTPSPGTGRRLAHAARFELLDLCREVCSSASSSGGRALRPPTRRLAYYPAQAQPFPPPSLLPQSPLWASAARFSTATQGRRGADRILERRTGSSACHRLCVRRRQCAGERMAGRRRSRARRARGFSRTAGGLRTGRRVGVHHRRPPGSSRLPGTTPTPSPPSCTPPPTAPPGLVPRFFSLHHDTTRDPAHASALLVGCQ